MALISPPGNDTVDRGDTDDSGKFSLIEVNRGWRNFFTSVYNICSALTQSGTTAQRPTTFLWVGRTYYDTTLTRPIWWTGAVWQKADGTPV